MASLDVFSARFDTLNVPMDLDSAYLHFSENSKSALFEGYTIQIFSGDRSGANAVRANIISLGIDSDARMVYREPNFKIHIGSFPDASAAERALVEWRVHYPRCVRLKNAHSLVRIAYSGRPLFLQILYTASNNIFLNIAVVQVDISSVVIFSTNYEASRKLGTLCHHHTITNLGTNEFLKQGLFVAY